ncbi:MAG: tRNA pseudouridine(38-40) synthase TruA [Lachnospiraceae bacterium]|nr:tRNA pseudouridine(38-40) synthase TruA [Lachnospiraceae bacterium]
MDEAETENRKKRVKLTVAYDGTNYCGWQVQPNGVSVASVLNRHLSELLQENIYVLGASRTDAGVHARGNVAVFDTSARMPADRISYALNTRLPEDIRIWDSREVASDFHPRFCETRKTYEYRICNRRFPDPCSRLYSLFYYWDLDVERMQKAADYLVGTHDFTSFCTAKPEVTNRVRTIYSLEVFRAEDGAGEQPGSERKVCPSVQAENTDGQRSVKDMDANPAGAQALCGRHDGMIIVRICGSGFLYNMVRIIVGTLLRIGSGMQEPEEMENILLAKNRSLAGDTAQAHGLTLMGIEYL